MGQFIFATDKTLEVVEQKLLPTLTASNPIFSIFPDQNIDTHLVEWEQMDNYQGMMQVRGLDGRPPKVNQIGSKSYTMPAGVYGEHMAITERQLTVERQWGTVNDPLDVTKLQLLMSNQLLHRQLMRKRWVGWQLLTTGFFIVTGPTGAILHADSYSQRTYTATIQWLNQATATPLQDNRNVQILARGYSIDLGAGAKEYMNRTTANRFISNTNPNDLGGKRMAGLSTVNSLSGINEILTGEGLPTIVVNDDGWEDETGTFNLDIPDNVAILVGRRIDGAPVGNWVNTRNAVNPGRGPGPYFRTIEPMDAIPPTIEVHRGFNGGIKLPFPSAIIVMKV